MKEGSPDDCFYRLSFSMLTGEASQCATLLCSASATLSFVWPDPVKKGRLMNDQSLRHTMILLLSGRTRPLKSHYFLCESLYPKGNPMHWDSRLDHHQTQECLLLDLFQCLSNKNRRLRYVVTRPTGEVETRDQPVDMLRWTSLPTARSESEIHCAAARSWRSPKIEDWEKQGKWLKSFSI